MVGRSRALLALLVFAALAFSLPAHAQSNRIRVQFYNSTASCVWITFYRSDSSGPAGIFADPVQIKEEPRTYTGPLYVSAHKNYTFQLPRYNKIKLRAEVQKTDCTSGSPGTIWDTSMVAEDGDTKDVMYFSLHKGHGNYYLTRP